MCCAIISSSSVGMTQADGVQTDREAIGIDRSVANPKGDQTSLQNALLVSPAGRALRMALPVGKEGTILVPSNLHFEIRATTVNRVAR
jgi:hypothetical protein